MQLWVSTSEEGNHPTVTFRLTDSSARVVISRIEYPNEAVFFEYAQASVWNQERKTKDWTEYYLLLKDGTDKPISVILKHNKTTNEVQVEPYKPSDWSYTIHDFCDHDGSKEGHGEYCVLDDPESEEFQEVAMADKYALAVRNLEAQLKQQKLAEQLITDKKKIR